MLEPRLLLSAATELVDPVVATAAAADDVVVIAATDVTDGISSVSPATAEAGDSLPTVVITLNASASISPPPSNVPVTSVTIGTIAASSFVRADLIVTAAFTIPAGTAPGLYDVTVSFPSPGGGLNFMKPDGFEITGDPVVVVGTYPIVDTAQSAFYDDSTEITEPAAGDAFYGQDAHYDGYQPSYTVSGDELTVLDNITGLTWTQSPDLDGDGDIDVDDKLTFAQAGTYAATDLNPISFGGYSDWRLPTMKELYSLMDFRGTDPDPSATDPSVLTPFIDTDYFDFGYGDLAAGERIIDAQFWSSNAYVDTVFNGQSAAFGLNLADGRIKGYPSGTSGPVTKLNYVYFVRGNTDYGTNSFTDNGDGTVTDSATGLMWSQDDSGDGVSTGPRSGMIWEDALAWVEQKNAANYLGHDDWRLPNAKEMQSILDYSRAPGATSSAAIDPVFNITQITNEGGDVDYPWFWTGTTHVRYGGSATSGVYICFGRATGYMNSQWMDVHGAGAQRSDQKDGSFSGLTYVTDGYYLAISPQGDATRSYNYVRLVRDAEDDPPVVTAVVLNGDRTVSDIEPSGTGVQTIEVTFSEAVTFASGDVSVQEVTFPGGSEDLGDVLTPMSVTGSGTDTMAITFDSASVVDTWVKVTLDGGATITDLAGNALDGETASGGSGRGYIYDALTDLPTGDGTAGGDAVFYVGSLRGDLYGGDLFEPDPNGALTDLDVAGFIAAYQGGNLDADFYGGDLFEPTPDGNLDDLDVAGFIAVYQAGASLDGLPASLSGAAVAGAASLSVSTESPAEEAVLLQTSDEKTTSSADDSEITEVATDVPSPEAPVKRRGSRGAKRDARSAAARRAARDQALADAESGADLPPAGDGLVDPLPSASL